MRYALIQRWGLIVFLLFGLGLFVYFDLQSYFSLDYLKNHRQTLLMWTNQHFAGSLGVFMLIYLAAVAFSIPGALFLTLTAGFLFGVAWGTFAVVLAATAGAYLVYLAVIMAFREWFAKRASQSIQRMEAGFKRNPFSYLLFLRLVPVFPFWLVNIVPALLGVSVRDYLLATLIGIIPGSLVYVSLGNGLGRVFDAGDSPNTALLVNPEVVLPLLALAILSLVPVLYRLYQSKTKGEHE